jgi:hypothetical protein
MTVGGTTMKGYECSPLYDGSGRYVIFSPSGQGFAHTKGFRAGQQDREYTKLIVDALNAYGKPTPKQRKPKCE